MQHFGGALLSARLPHRPGSEGLVQTAVRSECLCVCASVRVCPCACESQKAIIMILRDRSHVSLPMDTFDDGKVSCSFTVVYLLFRGSTCCIFVYIRDYHCAGEVSSTSSD